MLDAAPRGVKDELWGGLPAGQGLAGKLRPRFRGLRGCSGYVCRGGVRGREVQCSCQRPAIAHRNKLPVGHLDVALLIWVDLEVRPRKGGEICGRNSVVECQLPKLDVGGSNPLARSSVSY
jgi:hypothetical protein